MPRPCCMWLLTLLLSVVFCGCSTVEDPAAAADSKKEISIMIPNFYFHLPPDFPKPNDPVLTAIQKHTAMNVQITLVPEYGYREKVSTMMASGDLPMVLVVTDIKSPPIINSVRSGFFWELGPYLKDYPYLNQFNEKVLRNISIDGKLYALYRARPLVSDGVVYRKDWLKPLGLQEPRTLQQLYEVIKAFTRNDPDRNGLNDTIGLIEDSSFRGFKYALAIHGAPNEWLLEEGKLIPSHMTKQYLDTLKFYKRLYDEKLINADFPIISRSSRNEAMSRGKAGMYFSDPDHVVRHADLFKLYPNAELDTFVRLVGAKGEKVLMDAGYTGMFMIPKANVRTESHLREILDFFNRLSDPAMQDLFVWGFKDIHHSISEGKPIRNPEQNERYTNDVTPFRQFLLIPPGTAARSGYEDKLVERYREVKKDMEPNALSNPAAHLNSKTRSNKGEELNKLIEDSRVKFILGKIDEQGWNIALQQWLKQGGLAVIREINEDYGQSMDRGAGR